MKKNMLGPGWLLTNPIDGSSVLVIFNIDPELGKIGKVLLYENLKVDEQEEKPEDFKGTGI